MKKIIVISAINITNGGPLSIIKDELKALVDYKLCHKYNIIVLVNNINLYIEYYKFFEFIQFPLSKKNWLFRFFYEYIWFYLYSKKVKPYVWLSMHDITPNVIADIKAVYCHNPSPFYESCDKFSDIKFKLFCRYYKYLYKINIKKNNFIIVQQDWIRNKFKEIYNVDNIVVAYPEIIIEDNTKQNTTKNNTFRFIYTAYPRSFKNFEVIFEATKKLNKKYKDRFEVIVTIDGTENKYSKWLYHKYANITNIKFIGLQAREKVFELYGNSNCLIFPSKLETWGLPITECKNLNIPIILSNMPYAKETIGNYAKVKFFNCNDNNELASIMKDFLLNKIKYDINENKVINEPFAKGWNELFNLIFK